MVLQIDSNTTCQKLRNESDAWIKHTRLSRPAGSNRKKQQSDHIDEPYTFVAITSFSFISYFVISAYVSRLLQLSSYVSVECVGRLWYFVAVFLRSNTSRLRTIYSVELCSVRCFAMRALSNFLHNLLGPPAQARHTDCMKKTQHTPHSTLPPQVRARTEITESALRRSTSHPETKTKTLSHHATFFRPVYFVALKHSPSKRKSLSKTAHQRSQDAGDSADAHRKCLTSASFYIQTPQPPQKKKPTVISCAHSHIETRIMLPDSVGPSSMFMFPILCLIYCQVVCVFLLFMICKLIIIFPKFSSFCS